MPAAQFIDFGHTDPATSQAVYHGLAATLAPPANPIVDVVTPTDQYVCIGAYQDFAKAVDREAIDRHDLPVYRRHVGGGTVLLDADQLFWHFILPASKCPAPNTLFQRYLQPVIDTFQALGIDAQYDPVNDIVVGDQKIAGTGAGRIDDAIMIVGSFMFDFDIETMVSVTPTPSPEFEQAFRQGLRTNMTTISEQLTSVPDRITILQQFQETLADQLDWTLTPTTPTDEQQSAIDTYRDTLADPDWLARTGLASGRSRRKLKAKTHLAEGQCETPGGIVNATVLTAEEVIDDLLLTGDLQVFPKSGLAQLATDLIGCPVVREQLEAMIDESLQRHEIVCPGVEPADIATAILRATAA